ncbi:MAG: O-antigen ligase family protein [Thermodesulfobacteriota bacterium]
MDSTLYSDSGVTTSPNLGTQGPTSRSHLQILSWGVFCFTCFQLAFLQPYLVIFPGERANLFSGLLCLLSLIAAMLVARQREVQAEPLELIICGILVALAVVSGLLSSSPFSSSIRGFVLICSGLGGFWCARILLSTRRAQEFFTWFCLALLAGIVAMSLVGYVYMRDVKAFLDPNPHPLADRMILLSFAPLVLLLRRGYAAKLVGGALMAAGYVVFYLSNLRSAMLIPVAMAGIGLWFRALRLRHFLVLAVIAAVAMVYFFAKLPAWKLGKDHEPAYYRAENYLYSWHIAKQHPAFGIGLRAPREAYLNDYEITYPYVTKERFALSVQGIVTSENIFLTLMVGLGVPFVILYSAGLIILLARLFKVAKTGIPESYLPPLALVLPITGSLIHNFVFDGLLYPQLCWYFHILLGLIPLRHKTDMPAL